MYLKLGHFLTKDYDGSKLKNADEKMLT